MKLLATAWPSTGCGRYLESEPADGRLTGSVSNSTFQTAFLVVVVVVVFNKRHTGPTRWLKG